MLEDIEQILKLDPTNLNFHISFIASKSAVTAVLGSDDSQGETMDDGYFFTNNLLIEVVINRDLIPKFKNHNKKWEFIPRKNEKYVKAKLFIQ